MEELKMTEQISLKLTFEELEQIDKYVELNEDTRQLFDKIQKAYPKSPVEAAYKRVFGEYPPTTPSVHNFDDNQWFAFQKGYSCGYGDSLTNDKEEKLLLKKIFQEERERQEENERIERNLKTSLQELSNGDVRPIDDVVKEAKKEQESWMNKPINELVEILNKNPPDCLKFEMGKTLEDRIYKWWTTCFTTKCEWSMEECLDDLLDIIELFLPREQSHEGTQNVNTIFAVEAHNELLQKIKSKLRNKKI